ncbi:CbrC family protein, partial [Escherichia coli]|uniref:CbrC family protein n=1 Tax=Escherichia coli TaxID=562 RepID=UPI0016014DE2
VDSPNVSDEIITEILEETPGYESWQGNIWLYHCSDGCEFHGDLSKQEAKNLNEEAIRKFCFENDLDKEFGEEIIQHYEKGGNPAIYKFVCRHCGEIKLYTDFT